VSEPTFSRVNFTNEKHANSFLPKASAQLPILEAERFKKMGHINSGNDLAADHADGALSKVQ